MSLLDKIKSRGYWNVLIRPADFRADRVTRLPELLDIIRRSAVSIRGWNFPHVADDETLVREQQHIRQEIEFGYILDYWRFYKSGQFVHMCAMKEDWEDQATFTPPRPNWRPLANLSVGHVIFRLLEVYELAGRLAMSDAGASRVWVKVSMHRLNGRTLRLELPQRMGFLSPRTANSDDFVAEREWDQNELVARPGEIALETARDLFELFNWDATIESLESIKEQLLRL